MHHILSQLLSAGYCVTIFLLFYPVFLFSMDTPTIRKIIDLKLDDGSMYSIEKWKVKKESNTLCDCYYSQGKKNPIIVPRFCERNLKKV